MQNKTLINEKRLRLVRHAKSSWKHDFQDINRPLKKRGIKDSNRVASHLNTSDFSPNLILSSPAKRAVKTAEIFIENLDLSHIPFETLKALYDFSGENLIQTIKNIDNSINDLLIFGHNNALTYFVNTFGSVPIENMVTSGYIEILFNENSWKDITQGISKKIVFPKDLVAN